MKNFYQFINENKKFLNKKYILDLLNSKIYFDYSDVYPNYSKTLEEDDDVMFSSKEKAVQHINFIIDVFNSLPNPIPIFRTLYAKNENEIDLEYLGESWSFEKENAISFGSHNGSNFLISALIDKKYVNWEETIKRFVIFSGGDGDDENEIVVDEQSKIKNIEIKPIKWKN